MSEVWLRTNRRVTLLGLVACLIPASIGAALFLSAEPDAGKLWRGAGSILVAAAAIGAAVFLWKTFRPKLAFEPGMGQEGTLAIHLRPGEPIRVPIHVVEGFLLGQSPVSLPGTTMGAAKAKALVIRLAQNSAEWSHQDVSPTLGKWCDGYVVIRGTWCEPLSVELVNRLNRRLSEVQRAKTPHAENRSANDTAPADCQRGVST